MTFAAFWLLQDMLVVLTSGVMRTPEIFLLSLVYHLLTRGRDVYVFVIWAAFLGGLTWDLRWVRIPGFFTLAYVGVIMVVLWFWNTLPSSGRSPGVIFSLFWAAQMLPVSLFILILEGGRGDASWAYFLVQQGYVVPLALLGTFFYTQHEKGKNA